MNASRRKVLKGFGLSLAALSTGTLSAWALAKPSTPESGVIATTDSVLPCCDITIYRQKSIGREQVTLMNLTDKPVRLDSIRPVGLENVNDRLSVTVNSVADGQVVLTPGERLTFGIEAVSKGSAGKGPDLPNVVAGHVQIRSDHPAFNGVIPVTVFDSQA